MRHVWRAIFIPISPSRGPQGTRGIKICVQVPMLIYSTSAGHEGRHGNKWGTCGVWHVRVILTSHVWIARHTHIQGAHFPPSRRGEYSIQTAHLFTAHTCSALCNGCTCICVVIHTRNGNPFQLMQCVSLREWGSQSTHVCDSWHALYIRSIQNIIHSFIHHY